jgi:hypothetical protein
VSKKLGAVQAVALPGKCRNEERDQGDRRGFYFLLFTFHFLNREIGEIGENSSLHFLLFSLLLTAL